MEFREGINKEDEEDFLGVMKVELLKFVFNVDCIMVFLEIKFLGFLFFFLLWLFFVKNLMENVVFLGLVLDNIV